MSTLLGSSSKWVVAALLAAAVSFAESRNASSVVWLDFDMQTIPEPKEREGGFYEIFFKAQILEQTKQDLDVPRWVRALAGRRKQAANVNAVDEVPNSSWYTNRHHLRKMTIEELALGSNQAPGPLHIQRPVITNAKTTGVTPGLQIKDAKGDSYLIKFDNINYPELQSGAEVITTKILYAAGYNVPENYIAFLDMKEIEIGKDVETTDLTTLKKRPLTRDDLDEMLRRVARTPDGRHRVLASKILSGKAKGPFPQVGLRGDDPNDVIPHEHRRELRGLKVIASWINHWDLKEDNALDMYVEENGRKFLRHYLIDFGSSLGAGRDPTEYFHGREYAFDPGSITKEMVTLGFYRSADDKRGLMKSPAVGMFTSDDFDPGSWKPSFPVIAFDDMTSQDAYWGARVILSFTEPEIRAIVETAEYSDPTNTDYVVRTLLERQAMVARHWLRKGDALAGFSVQPSKEGVSLKFRDLLVERKLAERGGTSYTYEVNGQHYKSAKMTTRDPEMIIQRSMLGAAIEGADPDVPIEIVVWTSRNGSTSNPVKVYFDWNPTRETLSIKGISRS